MLSRRTLILGALSVSFAPAGSPAAAEPLRFLSVTQQLADVLDAVAKGIKDLGDAFAHLVALGVQGYDLQAARRAHSQLVDLRVQLEELVSGPNTALLGAINSYLKKRAQVETARNDIDADWKNVIGAADAALQNVLKILDDVKYIRSDFVFNDAYRALQEALQGRSTLLQKLQSVDPPVTPNELLALKDISDKYREVSLATRVASDQIAAYVKTFKT